MAGLIPRPFIDELLNRIDIVEYIEEYIPLKKRGSSYIACCPFHQEKTPSFNVIPKKQFYHCFGCGESGNLISFAMNYSRLSFTEAIESLANRVGLEVPREGKLPQKSSLLPLYDLLKEVSLFYQSCLTHSEEVQIYLNARGISSKTALTYELGYAKNAWHQLEQKFPNHINSLITTGMLVTQDAKMYDRYRDRLMFPIHDRKGRVIGFGGRTLDNQQKPKYLNSPETTLFHKNKELYGLFQILKSNQTIDALILVEGYMDVIALAEHGMSNAVATLGTATNSHHVQIMQKYTQKIIACFDGDTAGQSANWRLIESSLPYLNDGLEINFVIFPQEHDPDSFIQRQGKEAFLKELAGALPLHRVFFNHFLSQIEIQSLSGKTKLIHQVKPFLIKIGEGPYLQLMLQELSRLTFLDLSLLKEFILGKEIELKRIETKEIKRSPFILALALLLQEPKMLSPVISDLSLDYLNEEKYAPLKLVIDYIKKHPQTETAALIESFRETAFFTQFNQLAAWNHQVPQHAIMKEFSEILTFFAKKAQENKIQQLIKKAKMQTLNETERHLLQTLLKERHLIPSS